MAHQGDCNVSEAVVQLLNENGLSQMAEVIRLLRNEAMRIERSQALEAEPYERSEKRRGYANGYKPKTVDTRVGPITFQVPQARGTSFYPSALERGVRSEKVRHAGSVVSCAVLIAAGIDSRGHRSFLG